jgi:hypothetical protein
VEGIVSYGGKRIAGDKLKRIKQAEKKLLLEDEQKRRGNTFPPFLTSVSPISQGMKTGNLWFESQ